MGWRAVSSSCIPASSSDRRRHTLDAWPLLLPHQQKQPWNVLLWEQLTPRLSPENNHLIWVYVWNTALNPNISPYLWRPVEDSPLGTQPALLSRSLWSRWFSLPCHELCSCCCEHFCQFQLIIFLMYTPPSLSILPTYFFAPPSAFFPLIVH